METTQLVDILENFRSREFSFEILIVYESPDKILQGNMQPVQTCFNNRNNFSTVHGLLSYSYAINETDFNID